MALHYGVLKCKAIDRRLGTRDNAHYQVHAVANGIHYRIAVNVKSQTFPSELLYVTDEYFQHEVTTGLPDLPFGFNPLSSKQDGMALDYIRGNLLDRKEMIPLAFDTPGQDNDLNEKLDMFIRRAIDTEDAELYAFGDVWGPEAKLHDKVFGFLPGNGVHNIHMNQGNSGSFSKDNGVYQDGGLMIRFPAEKRWIAIFLAFQSQAWHTDDKNGNPLISGPIVTPTEPHPGQPIPAEEALFITAALVQPAKLNMPQSVTLLNVSDRDIQLNGWSISNKAKLKIGLHGTIRAGESLLIPIQEQQPFLRLKGDLITLLDASGLKVVGVDYTTQQVRSGWSIRF